MEVKIFQFYFLNKYYSFGKGKRSDLTRGITKSKASAQKY